MHKQILISVALLFFIATCVVTGPGCANIIPPQGGPRDSLPPVLVKVSPADSTLNFKGSRINFTFNEFIDLQELPTNLVISPIANRTPSVDSRLNTLTVRIKDTLDPNTTYTISFGSAIRDFNEGNVLKNFSYTFSTGNYFDSLELRGNVLVAETGQVDTTIVVILHTNPSDSAVIKEKPRYVARLDSRGNFVFKNLPPKTFYLYALKDEGGTHRYFGNKQLFGFADKPINTTAKNEPVTIYAFASNPGLPVAPVGLTNLGNRNKPAGSTDKRLKYSTNLVNTQLDLLNNFIMQLEQPLRSFDSTRIRLYTDSTFNPVTGFSVRMDSTKRKIILVNSWKENTEYRLILDKDFAEDSAGHKLLKTDTLIFRTKKLADYGSLKLKFKNLDLSKHPIAQIMTGDIIIKAFPMTGNELYQAIFLPGEYDLRILFDQNGNGKWDPGEFFGKHKQPEITKMVDRKIVVKAGFANEFEISL